jgi:hypothetical protein
MALAASTVLAISSPASAQSTPSFRVPMGAAPTSSTVEPTYAWLETLGNCSTSCGTGTRSTTYQCQNVADYDYSGVGYGLPEPDSMCAASAGPRPASTSASCTVYSGCGYDWVRPPVVQTPIPLTTNPVGRLGCGYVKTVFSPYCQRTGSGANVVMANGDHRFCSGDRPDYDPVAAGDPDALGYDRNVTQTSACSTPDHEWRPGDATTGWGSWVGGGGGDCDTASTRTRAVVCYRKFDGSAQPDTSCDAGTRPASTQTEARYASCSYSYVYGTYGAWSSNCDTNATRTRTATCTRSNNGGQAVADSECSSRGIAKEATSETSAQYSSCSYTFQPTAWSTWSSGCDTNATRTRTAPCVRSNNGGQTVADTECTNRGQTKPATSETGAQYGSCDYTFSTGSWGSWSNECTSAATRTRSVTCMRNNNGGTAVADSECTSRGVSQPASSETSSQYGACSYSRGGETGVSGWDNGCSGVANRTHYYSCIRSDGTAVASSECTGRGIAVTSNEQGANYASCTYRIEDAGVGACQSNNQAPHYWRCVRNQTGEQVDSSAFCGRSNPTYDACTYYSYSLRDSGVGACQTNDQAPHYWKCIRSPDGVEVDSATYCGRAATTYDSCSYPWGYTPNYSGWNACSASGTQTRSMSSCTRSDGTAVSTTYCTNAGHQATQSQSCENNPYPRVYGRRCGRPALWDSCNFNTRHLECVGGTIISPSDTRAEYDIPGFCTQMEQLCDTCFNNTTRQNSTLQCAVGRAQGTMAWDCSNREDTMTLPQIEATQVDSNNYCTGSAIAKWAWAGDVQWRLAPAAAKCTVLSFEGNTYTPYFTYYNGPASKRDDSVWIDGLYTYGIR